ncbi:MAG: flagellar basal-body rod protein FlgF [bacterium]
MLRGFYISASGMTTSQTQMDVTSNNLSNTNTEGFKEDKPVFKAYPQKQLSRTNDNVQDLPADSLDVTIDRRPDIGPLNMGSASDGSYTDYTQGGFKNTGNPLDFALDGDGFFEVQLPDGTRAYTRSGDFKLNQNGEVVTSNGYNVMGEDGPLQLPQNPGQLNVTGNGQVLNNNGQSYGQLRVVQFENPQKLRKRGDTMFLQGENNEVIEATEDVKVKHKHLEGSNTNPIDEMTEMVRVSRRYEMNQRSLRRQDQMLQQAIQQVGRN